jgi:hypothetical protein
MAEFFWLMVIGIPLLIVLLTAGLITLLCIRKIQPGRAGVRHGSTH